MPPEFHRDGWPIHYVLVGRTPMAVDMMTWATQFEQRFKGKRDLWRVARTYINKKCYVSTVFMGLDHSFGGGEPVLFETMVFGGPTDQEYQWRYRTFDEAERGHRAAVEETRKAVAQIADMLRRAHRSSKGWRRHIRQKKATERS
jgi:hypothetical protein